LLKYSIKLPCKISSRINPDHILHRDHWLEHGHQLIAALSYEIPVCLQPPPPMVTAKDIL